MNFLSDNSTWQNSPDAFSEKYDDERHQKRKRRKRQQHVPALLHEYDKAASFHKK
jgi:hypothetical protein